MSGLPDAGAHLLHVAKITFDAIEEPGGAVDTAVALVREILGHLPPEQRLQGGCLLIGMALRTDPTALPVQRLSPRRGGDE